MRDLTGHRQFDSLPRAARSAAAAMLAIVMAGGCGSVSGAGADAAAGSSGSGGSAAGGVGGNVGGAGGNAGGAGGGVGGGGNAGGGAGGGAGGRGGSGGGIQYACLQQGGSCLSDCTTPCQTGSHLATASCPISESNAVCGGHCCLPTVVSDGGSGDAGASSYTCGAGSCTTGQTFCYSYLPGTPGGSSTPSCMTLPAACAASPTCACVCPPSSSTAFGCTFAGGNTGGSCSCTDTNGMLTVTCAGV
jgi:hypothetical protein